MGTFTHHVTLLSASGDHSETIEAMVDSGSTFTWIPAPILEQLGIRPQFEREFVLAEGRLVRRAMAEVRVQLDSEQHTTLCVFGPQDSQPLLGAYTLEAFSLAADVTNRRLITVPNYALALHDARQGGLGGLFP